MPRAIVLGNGNILVGLDKRGEVRDFYFPYVGLENQVGPGPEIFHRLGIFADGVFRWLSDPGWEISLGYAPGTFESVLRARNEELGIEFSSNDIVYNEKNIFLRQIEVTNLRDRKREIKFFFHQAFQIRESYRGDTAYFDPKKNILVHYKGERALAIGALGGGRPFKEYSVGLFGSEGRAGTYKDAEDGILSMNAIEHGEVDSVLALALDLKPKGKERIDYWITAGSSIAEAGELSDYVLEKSPDHILKTTRDFWRAWAGKGGIDFQGVSPAIVRLFGISLFVIRAHVDNRGAVIASTDDDMLQYGRDTYAYMWPRDSAFAALALDKIGDTHIVERFFSFCNNILSPGGYFMHKYCPDGSLGSSWHPWLRDGEPELPIQEDETAAVLIALWGHYEISKDLEFVEGIYNSLIKKSAEFLVGYLNPKTGLPHPSYDLWEENYGVSTYTASSVYGALRAAASFAELLGKTGDSRRYEKSAELLKAAILKNLYDDKEGAFYKLATVTKEGFRFDATADVSSVYGPLIFGVLLPDDERLEKAFAKIEKELTVKTRIGGLARYKGDAYHKKNFSDGLPGNPWFITTLWLAKYYILKAKNKADLDRAREWLIWATDRATEAGILAEQIDPQTGEPLSASPLTWSHAEFVLTTLLYLEKLKAVEN